MFHGGQSDFVPAKYCLAAKSISGLALVLLKSMAMQCDRQKSIIMVVVFGYADRVMMEIEVYFKHKIQSNILSRPNRFFLIDPRKY